MKKIEINMCDIGFGANHLGIQHGYTMIKKLKPDLSKKINYLDYNLHFENMSLEKKKFYNTIYQACLNVYYTNLDCLEKGKIPILIGGDHSLALGSIKASLMHSNEDIGLIWIDAHADINTFSITETGNIHGTPVSSIVGLNDKRYNELGNNLHIKFENLIYYATRAIDNSEQKLINKHGILEISDSKIKDSSLDKWIDYGINHLKKRVSKIHISLDLDSINPQHIKGVSTPVSGGLDLDEPFKIIKEFSKNFDVVAIDIVEYNPLKDTDQKTVDYIDSLVNDLLDLFK